MGASLQVDLEQTTWYLEPRFQVRPGAGLCFAQTSVCSEWRLGAYDDVQALQLAGKGRTLAVLHSGGRFLDGWNLEAGALLGRWRLAGGNFIAMCHDDTQLHFARHSSDGPT